MDGSQQQHTHIMKTLNSNKLLLCIICIAIKIK